MKRTFAYSLSLFTIFVVLTGLSAAQVATGTPAFNSFGGGPFDTVNLGNLNVHFAVPILHKAGRGLPFAYDLSYDSSVWTPVGSSGSQSWQPAANWGWQSPWGGAGYMSATPTVIFCQDSMGHNDGTTVYVSGFAYHDPWGITHPFNGQLVTYNPNCTGTNITSFTSNATDGSGLKLSVSQSGGSNSLTTPSGLVISTAGSLPTGPVPTTSTDANGNQITQANVNGNAVFTDTLGQSVLTISGTTNPVTFQYTPPGGTAVQYKLNYTALNIKTNFGCSGVAEYTATNVLMVTSITLPDNTSYSFSYEPTQGGPSGYYTGRISQVTLPTGGTITYAYPLTSDGQHNAINCVDGSAPAASGTNPSMTRTLSSPGGPWKYYRTQVSGNHWQTKVSTPPDSQNSGSASDDTVIDFEEDATTGNTATYGFYETQRQAYQGSQSGGTLLLTTLTCWNGNTSNCTTTGVSSPIASKSVTLEYPSGGLQSNVTTQYNSVGLVTEVDQSAYGSAPGSTIRSTYINYANLNNNIYKPASVTVTDGGTSGHVLSKTTYTYDEYSTYPLQPTTNTPHQVSISGSRGNATTITSTVIGTTTLTRHFAYYDTGNVYKSYDVNGAVTQYNYDTTTWETNTTKSCGNSFATGFTLPISGLSTNAYTTWNCIGGVVIGSTDLNNNTTSMSYQNDPDFWRPDSVTDPTNAITSFSYTAYNGTNLANVDSKMLFNSNNSVAEQLATFGTFGQALYSQQHEAPTGKPNAANYDSTQVLYDSFLRAYKSSMPCVSTTISFTDQNQACPSAAVTTGAFDALGRVTEMTDGGGADIKYTYNQNDVKSDIGPHPLNEGDKLKQVEYDALGRLTSVCEITQLSNGTCGQTSANYNGYMTTYAYGVNGSGYPTMTVTQGPSGSTQTRVYTYDLLGRLISEQNPENGTVTYTYDSDSSGVCSGTYTGDLVKVVDAKGNKICYQYDAIHRNIGITYPSSGPDASVTQSKTFVYDSATYNGTSMLNPKGRLVEAYTGASGSKTTDEFFQYSVRGELTDTWECTPHSGTNGCASVSNYYHVTAGFWANGALNTLNSNISGLPNQTYGVDGMGRANAVSASAGQTPLVNGASTSYGLYQSTVTYGSGDSDVVSLDPNTGRMTQYVFNVGSQNVTGNLTWNSDGSLLKLVITNQLNTLDTQTCGYTRDDLSRISSVGCANGSTNRWNQQFTYDAFGNITKTVPVGGTGTNFQPTYSSSSNWITALPGATPLTDANGQMTNDGAHTYTWDAEHKMHSVDANPSSCSTSGECLTYDALGRMVEKTVGSTYTQIVYGPQGRFATMNGQTLVKAFIPLPGSQAVYTSASLNTSNKVAYYRHTDHLGSSRLATTPTQTLYSSTAYGPYGEPYSQSGATDLSFTGQEQDTVSGIYDFPARKYPPVQGRWLSPDPAGLAAANPANPQSWNRYAYVLNNPMSLVDPLGLDPCDTDSGGWQCFTQPPQPSPPVGPFGGPCMGSGGGSQNGTCDPGEPGPPWGPGCTSNGVCVAPGGGGGGPSSLLALIGKPVMPHNPLADCTQDLFGVTMDSFVQSQIGEDGSFTGTTAGVFQGFRVPAAPGPYAFTVNFDATTHNSGQITDMYVEIMGPVPANTFVYGVTPSTNPFHAYVALDLPPTGPNVLNMQAVQLWELGNALSVITGKQWPQNLNVQPGPNNNEPGNVLTNCVQQHGG